MLHQWELIKDICHKYRALIIVSAISVLLIVSILFLIFNAHSNENEFKQTDENKLIGTNTHMPSLLKEDNGTSLNNKTNQRQNNTKHATIYVDIKGAVKHPNIYKMASDDRMKQLLDKAVVSVNADLSNINLSEKLVDQKMVYIPEKGEDLNTQNDKKTSHNVNYATHLVEASKNSNDAAININTATESQLISIPGIGQTKAKSIIEYREQNGDFKSLDQLKEINGIGAKTVEKLSSYLSI
ncbi:MULTISPECIES: helix-hairpin-helix domain-containing protein [Staphylococcus]|uniref:helix-hairpin-helix domain-containing protein n=1 Tax=Staphylococcus TaxID=1279 RepID=UPI000BC2DE6A|nr:MULTISPECIES: helix-hairpin-helix domain-containing protein [Staphylococcus]ATH59954.1 hypothetical protein BJD96_06400 [Staphylococcus nepalensis]ATH65045.1 hypothetical protein BJG89_06730 [Staphylococcus nepalensis]AWI44411.1 hypothetical protein BJG88_06525 [Staphylococcus nepalensis]NWN84904.1 helix-hairpin-helix domain-containing protein [Staphylococcus sp.]